MPKYCFICKTCEEHDCLQTATFQRSPASSTTLTASETEKAMINVSADSPLHRSPASSTTLTASETEQAMMNVSADSPSHRSPASSTTLTASETEKAMMNVSADSSLHRSPATSIDSSEIFRSPASVSSVIRINQIQDSNPRKRKRLSYLGDITMDDLRHGVTRKKCMRIIKKNVASQKKRCKISWQREKRMRDKIHSLKSLLDHLKNKRMISENAGNIINASVSDSTNHTFLEQLKKKTKKYSPELRRFALTLSFYSKKAYEYVREKFNKNLPHSRTLRKWYETIDASPGFSKEALQALRKKSMEAESQGYKLLCNIVFDEMAIRKQIEWDGKKYYGFVDLGTGMDSDNLEEAKEAIVFMLVALNQRWKIPIAYFLVNALDSNEKANLLLSCLEFIHGTGVIVTSVTFDGPPTNWNMASKLGADVSVTSSRTYFLHPITKDKIYIFLDPSHMIKLVRNSFGSNGELENSTGQKICWSYIEKLVEIQKDQGLNIANKLKKRHLLWFNEKMKVNLAVQTLSNSVAEALNFLNKDLKMKDFEGSESTAEFCKIFNNLFDIFNSRNILTKKPFEKPLSPAVESKYFEFLDTEVEYISGLKINGELLIASRRKTGFLGLVICIKSLKGLYSDHVLNSRRLKYLLTYKLSQDHLEIFFSCIRSKSGFNNNPSAKQFIFTMRRLIIHTDIRGSETANAISLDSTSILHCTSGQLLKDGPNEELNDMEAFILDEGYLNSNIWDLTDYVEEVVKYISGFVVRKLKPSIMCSKCSKLLEDDEIYSKLQIRKMYGKLTKASMFVINICKQGEKSFRLMKSNVNFFSNNYSAVKLMIMRTMIDLPGDIFKNYGDHFYDEEPLSNHGYALAKMILQEYFKIRIFHELSSSMDEKLVRVRSRLTKAIIFKNQ